MTAVMRVRRRLATWLDYLAVWLVGLADRLHPPLWTPFGEDGKLRPELADEGWHQTGALMWSPFTPEGEVQPKITRSEPCQDR